ncbi:MAG: hypothetical protein WC070_05155 [Candidatus Magasanikbacteria bacterium]
MRSREQLQNLGVFEKTKFDQFVLGQKIAINIDGDWKEVTLRETLSQDNVKNGKLNLKISYEKTPGNFIDLELAIGYEPKIVKYANGLIIQDADFGDFTIADGYVAEDGSIEYKVTDEDNNTEIGISQDIIDLWKSVNEVKQNIANLESRIDVLSTQKKSDFVARLHEANKLVAEIFANLEVSKMNKLDKDQVKDLQERLAGLIKESEQVLKSLSDDIVLVPPTTSVRAKISVDFKHSDTEKDEDAIQKELEKNAKNAEIMKKDLDQKIKEAFDEIESERAEMLAQRIETKRAEFVEANSDRNGNLKKGKTFNESSVKLTAKEEKQFKDKKNKVKREIYKNFFERSGRRSELQVRILDEVRRLRIEMAQIDSTNEDSQFQKDSSDNVVDYLKPDVNSDEYLDSAYLAKNIELLDQVLQKVIEKKSLGEKTTETREVFDFSSEVEKSKNRMQELLNSIPKKEDGNTPEDAFLRVYKLLQKRLEKFVQESSDLSSIDLARSSGLLRDDENKEKLQEIRFDLVNDTNRELDGVSRKIQEIKNKEEISKISKRIENQFEVGTPVIDMTEPMMQEILKSQFVKVEDALTALLSEGLYYDDVDDSKNIRPKILEKFKNIISDSSPNPALLAKLREAGIKNWDDFKQLWDEKLAGQAAATVDKMLQAVMKKEIAQNITWWDKTKKFKGQIAARVAITTALVGGGAFAASVGMAAAIGSAAVGAVAGGAVGGGIRGALNKLLFGNKRMQARSERLQKELEDDKKDEVIKNIVGKVLGSLDSRIVATSNIEELPSFSAIMAQTVRDLTTEMSELSEQAEIVEAKNLNANARVLYERALAHLEITDAEVDKKRKLAQIIAKMNGKGDIITAEIVQNDSQIMGLLEEVVSVYSGKKSIMASAVMGGLVGAAFFVDNDITRISMGAVFGGIKGYKEGKFKQIESEQNKVRKSVYQDIADLRNINKQLFDDPNFTMDSLNETQRKALRDKIIRLKRLLHINAEPSELAVFGVVKQDKDGNYLNYNGQKVISADGQLLDAEARMLFADMRSAVTDAERVGLLQEKQEDRKNINIVLQQLQERSKEIEDGLPKARKGLLNRFGNWLANHTYRSKTFNYTVGGAVLGGFSAWLIGEGFNKMRENALGVGFPKEGVTGKALKFDNIEGEPAVMEGIRQKAQLDYLRDRTFEDIGRQGQDAYFRDSVVDHSPAAEYMTKASDADLTDNKIATTPEGNDISPVAVVEKEQPIIDDYVVKKGDSLLGILGRWQDDLSADNILVIRQAHPEWAKLSDDRLLDKWSIAEAEKLGQRFDKNGQYFKTGLRPGNVVHFKFDADGYPHIEVDGMKNFATEKFVAREFEDSVEVVANNPEENDLVNSLQGKKFQESLINLKDNTIELENGGSVRFVETKADVDGVAVETHSPKQALTDLAPKVFKDGYITSFDSQKEADIMARSLASLDTKNRVFQQFVEEGRADSPAAKILHDSIQKQMAELETKLGDDKNVIFKDEFLGRYQDKSVAVESKSAITDATQTKVKTAVEVPKVGSEQEVRLERRTILEEPVKEVAKIDVNRGNTEVFIEKQKDGGYKIEVAGEKLQTSKADLVKEYFHPDEKKFAMGKGILDQEKVEEFRKLKAYDEAYRQMDEAGKSDSAEAEALKLEIKKILETQAKALGEEGIPQDFFETDTLKRYGYRVDDETNVPENKPETTPLPVETPSVPNRELSVAGHKIAIPENLYPTADQAKYANIMMRLTVDINNLPDSPGREDIIEKFTKAIQTGPTELEKFEKYFADTYKGLTDAK